MLIDTPRLKIRPFILGDEAVVISLLSNPAFMEWSMGGPRTQDDARRILKEDVEEQETYGFSKYAVIDKLKGCIVGYSGFGVMQIESKRVTEFGYRLLPEARGMGYATEAGRAVIQDGFTRLDMRFIRSIVEPGNEPSRRVLDKLGFAHERPVDVDGREWLLYRLDRP